MREVPVIEARDREHAQQVERNRRADGHRARPRRRTPRGRRGAWPRMARCASSPPRPRSASTAASATGTPASNHCTIWRNSVSAVGCVPRWLTLNGWRRRIRRRAGGREDRGRRCAGRARSTGNAGPKEDVDLSHETPVHRRSGWRASRNDHGGHVLPRAQRPTRRSAGSVIQRSSLIGRHRSRAAAMRSR